MSSPRARISHGLSRERVALEIRRARGPFVVLVGLLLLTLVAAAYIVGNLRNNLPWEDPYRLQVAVDDAKGVVAGKNEVRISGVPVGLIEKVELVGRQPTLTIAIERRYGSLYRDARLRLRPKTPLNDLYLDVEDRGDSRRLDDDELIRAERTRTPVDIGRVLNVLNADTRARMERATDELGRGLPDRGEQLRAALVELSPFLDAAQRLTRELAVRRGATRRLVHNLRLLNEELGARDDQLTQLVRGGAESLTELGRADVPLAQTIAALPPTLRELQATFSTVRATVDELDPALDALRPAARALPEGMDALRSFSAEALPALAALRRPLSQLRPLVRVLRPTAIDLDRAFAALRPQAPRLDRITAAVVPCELAVAKFFQNTISVMKFSSSRVAFPRGHTVGGTITAGGLVNDPGHGPGPSCARGAPE